jgi:hypothetical protein
MEKGIQTLYCKEIISFDEHNDLIKKISDWSITQISQNRSMEVTNE